MRDPKLSVQVVNCGLDFLKAYLTAYEIHEYHYLIMNNEKLNLTCKSSSDYRVPSRQMQMRFRWGIVRHPVINAGPRPLSSTPFTRSMEVAVKGVVLRTYARLLNTVCSQVST